MEHSAEMSCVLKVNSQCETCRRKVMEVLQCLHGGYNISIDAEQGTVKVTGRVTPNAVLRTLERYGKHAEVKWIGFDGEVRGVGYYYGENGLPSPYSYPELEGYDYQPYGGLDYPWYDSYGHLPPAPPPMYRQPPPPPPPLPMYPPPPPPMYRTAPPPMFHGPLRPSPPRMDSNYDRCTQM